MSSTIADEKEYSPQKILHCGACGRRKSAVSATRAAPLATPTVVFGSPKTGNVAGGTAEFVTVICPFVLPARLQILQAFAAAATIGGQTQTAVRERSRSSVYCCWFRLYGMVTLWVGEGAVGSGM